MRRPRQPGGQRGLNEGTGSRRPSDGGFPQNSGIEGVFEDDGQLRAFRELLKNSLPEVLSHRAPMLAVLGIEPLPLPPCQKHLFLLLEALCDAVRNSHPVAFSLRILRSMRFTQCASLRSV